MQLYLDSYGAFLGVKDKMFYVKPKHHAPKLFAARNVHTIFLTKGVRVSSDALLLALAEQIPVLLTDATARPVGRLWHGRYGSIATIRKNQYRFCAGRAGWEWVRDILTEKIRRQRDNITKLRESTENDAAEKRILRRTVPILQHAVNQFKRWEYREEESPAATFRGWEGTAGRYYFKGLSALLPSAWKFGGRSHRPAEDRFNCLLNYLYGMLYGMTETALLKAGLDPALGVLHVDRYGGQPTLNFDFIEAYRHWADAVAVRLATADTLPLDTFQQRPHPDNGEIGWWLQNPGKGKVIETFLSYMNERIDIDGERRKRVAFIDKGARDLAQRLI